jgi:hypothetical protein
MNLVVLRRDPERLRATPCQRTHISVFLIILLEDESLGGIDLGNRIGNFEIQNPR